MSSLGLSSDGGIYALEASIVLTLFWGYVLFLAARYFGRSRPGLSLGAPVLTAFAVRLVSIYGVSHLSVGQTLRGGDETGFAINAHAIAVTPFGSSAWTDTLQHKLYLFVIAAQDSLFQPGINELRITEVGLATAGFLFVALAVYELAGPSAARLAMWVIAFEPSTWLFSQLLHKEPLMYLAEGLVAFGAAKLWRRASLSAFAPIVCGCLIALATRPYGGWFLIAASGLVALHTAIRLGPHSSFRGLGLLAAVIVLAALTEPFVLQHTSHGALSALQTSQNANSTATGPGNNLSLESVDFSTRGAIITNLPQRFFDVTFKPYPWQVANTSQQVGLIGTLVALGVIWFLIRYARLSRGSIMRRAGPIVYVTLMVLIGYSLSAGNAGTAFRYRTHVIVLLIGALVVLRQVASEKIPLRQSSARDERARFELAAA